MIRFATIEFRLQAAIALGALLVVAVLLAITGPHLVHVYDATVGSCQAHGDCSSATTLFLKTYRGLQIGLDVVVVAVPGILGIFWGAPLVARELEAGTYRLAWTQSVTRARWLTVKMAMVGLSTMAVAGLLSLMATWWSSPVDRVNQSVFTSFDQRALVPLGFALFAFALGVTTGVILRRTVPAMATTLVAFVATRLLVNHYVVPRLLSPTVRGYPLSPATVQGYGSMNGGSFNLFAGAPNIPNAWVYSAAIVDKSGHALSTQDLTRLCPTLGANVGDPHRRSAGGTARAVPVPAGAGRTLQECIARVGTSYHDVVTFQPGSHYWPLQWYELAIYLGAACVLGAVSLWWVRRRIT